MSDQLREYAKAIAGATKVIDKDGLVSYARDTTRFGAGLKESYELAVAYLAEHPEPKPITADWLRGEGWEERDRNEDTYRMKFGDRRAVLLWWHDERWNLYYSDGQVTTIVRPVTDTADLANLVAALRGGGA